LAHQGLAADLVAGQAGQVALEDDQLAVEFVDDRQRDLDPLQGRRRQHELAQERASVGAQQLVRDVDDAVIKQRRLDALQPARALIG